MFYKNMFHKKTKKFGAAKERTLKGGGLQRILLALFLCISSIGLQIAHAGGEKPSQEEVLVLLKAVRTTLVNTKVNNLQHPQITINYEKQTFLLRGKDKGKLDQSKKIVEKFLKDLNEHKNNPAIKEAGDSVHHVNNYNIEPILDSLPLTIKVVIVLVSETTGTPISLNVVAAASGAASEPHNCTVTADYKDVILSNDKTSGILLIITRDSRAKSTHFVHIDNNDIYIKNAADKKHMTKKWILAIPNAKKDDHVIIDAYLAVLTNDASPTIIRSDETYYNKDVLKLP